MNDVLESHCLFKPYIKNALIKIGSTKDEKF